MQQYWEIKSQHMDKILLFRMGDFFEIFHRDAEIAAPILNIALTSRNKKAADETKMCGVPHHSIATPIAKLLAAGHKVAMCDQIEDPALAKGIVKRAVTRVLTPGMVYDPDTLDQLTNNFLASYDSNTVAFADVTTGEAFYYDYSEKEGREELLLMLRPVEIVLSAHDSAERKGWAESGRPTISSFEMTEARGSSSASPESSVGDDPLSVRRLKAYAEKMQGADVARNLRTFERRRLQQVMELSLQGQRHLEIFETYRNETKGSLFWAVNRTQTSSGARLLKSWLHFPRTDFAEIEDRQNEISRKLENPAELKRVREAFSHMGDIERRLGKILSSTCSARDLVALAQSLQIGLTISRAGVEGLSLEKLAEKILTSFNDELPLAVKEGGLIRRGVSAELDELILLTQDSQRLLIELENLEKEQTGISSLKVRYNNVFGYYIELTKTHAHKAPAHYMRKQTLANAERFTTEALQKLEEKVLSARSRRDQLEFEIYQSLRAGVIDALTDITQAARVWAREDVLAALAWLAIERRYVRPRFNSGQMVQIELSRHPVIEQMLGKSFVPNSIRLEAGNCLLLTGPNMAGKSTVMRQVALTAILAQIGSYVPAEKAELPIFSRVFTRVGASDSLSEGLSTFMVEMAETAEILRKVDEKSLVVMDEIGRGTSTYDGMALAQAILEYLIGKKRPFLLFATHYHELTQLAQIFPVVHNAHMAVQEKGGDIKFLHSLKAGPANRSYGIQVARLAGVPDSVTKRASELLQGLEAQPSSQMSLMEVLPPDSRTDSHAGSSIPVASPLVEELADLNLTQLTPLQALNKLYEWQQKLS